MMKQLIATLAFVALMLMGQVASAVTIINCQPCSPASTTNNSCPKPTGLHVGQLLVAVFVHSNDFGYTAPSADWKNVESGSNGLCGQSTGNGPNFIYLNYAVATSAETGASTFVWTNPNGFGGGGAICAYDFVGYSSGSPFDPNSVPSCNSNSFNPSTTLTATSITTGVNNSRVVIAYDSSLQSGASTISGPGGATQRISIANDAQANFWMGDFAQATAGSVGNQSGSQTQNVQYNAIMFGLLNGPQAGGGSSFFWAFP